jgi:predicted CXXCH cytochrome family protein
MRPTVGAGTHSPAARDTVRYDLNGELQCTSCHDPHAERDGDPTAGKFLVKRSASSELCLSCHDALAVAGNESSHVLASASLTGARAGNERQTVAEAGCAACHISHGADPTKGRLIRSGATDDDTCLGCHATTGASRLVGAEMSRPWSHAATGRGGHDEAERFDVGGGARSHGVGRGKRHVACVDCHNPHAASARAAQAPNANGRLAGVWGIDLNGDQVNPARFEYEVCLKCHGDSAPPSALGGDTVRRAIADTNLRLVFAPSAPSSHPVAAPGRNPDVPSLKAPYTTASVIYCTDCHASDQSPAAGGAGSRGPHGSIYPHLLERSYTSMDPSVESPASYALCYKCHDRDTLLSEKSPFTLRDGRALPPGKSPALHMRHVFTAGTPCATCHDGHGVSIDAGNSLQNAHLISFNTTVVSANTAGRPVYTSNGARMGSCNLTCHGEKHDGSFKYRY